jgi:hypothetical protein
MPGFYFTYGMMAWSIFEMRCKEEAERTEMYKQNIGFF